MCSDKSDKPGSRETTRGIRGSRLRDCAALGGNVSSRRPYPSVSGRLGSAVAAGHASERFVLECGRVDV